MVAAVERATAAMTELVSEVLDLGKIEAGKVTVRREPLDLPDLIEAAVQGFAPRAAVQGLAIFLEFSPSLPRQILGDAVHLRQILYNLLGNALKFTERGHVRVAASVVKSGASPRLRLEVSDTGIGIPEGEQARLFQKYEQGEGARRKRLGGTGLGLAICRELVEAMGGRILCSSAAGKGSLFAVELPLHRAEPAGDAAEFLATPHLLAGKCVRIVSDYAPSAAALSRLLTSLDAEVETLILDEATAEHAPLWAAEPGIDALLLDGHGGDRAGTAFASCLAAAARPGGAPELTVLLHPLNGDFDAAAAAAQASGAVCKAQPASPGRLVHSLARGVWVKPKDQTEPAVPRLVNGGVAGLRVLAADDNEENRLVLARMLSALGCAHQVVSGGLAAVAAEAEHAFDIILLDYQMPDLGGPETARVLRDRITDAHPKVPILALTANAGAAARTACAAAGMDAVLAKPLSLEALRTALARYSRPGPAEARRA
jgi:CheY-like chemotaxis protein